MFRDAVEKMFINGNKTMRIYIIARFLFTNILGFFLNRCLRMKRFFYLSQAFGVNYTFIK